MKRLLLALVLAAAVPPLAACGSDAAGSNDRPELIVSAATSLKRAMTAYADEVRDARVRLAFGGSDELAAQIRQGVRPDVFASANTELPQRLFEDGLVEKPVVFTGNRLVIAVPATGGGARVRGLDDLAERGVQIAIGAPSVPVGAYTRKVLDRLPADRREAILGNVRSNEPDVGGVVGKLSQGAADAGFVYVTDVEGAGGTLRAIELPEGLQPSVAYGAAIVKGARQRAAAERFVDGLLEGPGQRALRGAGFQPPPAPAASP